MAVWTLKSPGAGLFDLLHWRRPAPVRACAPTREVSARRAEAMRGLFPKMSAWMARRSYLAEMGSVERYLSQATDLFDLECRIRDMERRSGTARLY
jgi:hypothetical protein